MSDLFTKLVEQGWTLIDPSGTPWALDTRPYASSGPIERWEKWQRELTKQEEPGADDGLWDQERGDLIREIRMLRSALAAIIDVHPELTADGYPRDELCVYQDEVTWIAGHAISGAWPPSGDGGIR